MKDQDSTAKAAEAQRERRALRKARWEHCAYPDIWADPAYDEYRPRSVALSKLAEGTGSEVDRHNPNPLPNPPSPNLLGETP